MLKEYASYFTAFLLNNLKEESKEKIERIILFGSAARGEAGEDSDVDFFIDTNKKTKKLEREIRKIEENFYKSREAALFKVKGITNELSIKIGKLREWKELERSISSTGIILYGLYEARALPSGVKHYFIIFWEKIGKNRGAFLNKVYGFKVKGKKYDGFMQRFSGRKLGKSCVMFPMQHKKEILNLLRDYKVEAKVIEVFG